MTVGGGGVLSLLSVTPCFMYHSIFCSTRLFPRKLHFLFFFSSTLVICIFPFFPTVWGILHYSRYELASIPSCLLPPQPPQRSRHCCLCDRGQTCWRLEPWQRHWLVIRMVTTATGKHVGDVNKCVCVRACVTGRKRACTKEGAVRVFSRLGETEETRCLASYFSSRQQ